MSINLNTTEEQKLYKNFDYKTIKNTQYATNQNLNTPKSDKIELSTKKNDDKSKKKLLAIGLAVAAVVTTAILCIKKGKASKLQNFDFKNVPSDFTGKVKGKLKNGDKVVMEYNNGVLVSSVRSGEKNVSKIYETVNGKKIVHITSDNKTSTIKLTQTQNIARKEQSELKELLDKNDNLTSADFKKRTDAIKYKSKSQQKTIDEIISDKESAEKLYKLTNKDVSEITFKDGKAYFNDQPYFSKVHVTLPNGDKVVMKYNVLGELEWAQRSGKVNYTKEYSGHIKCDRKVKITEGEKTEEIDLWQKGQEKLKIVKEEKLKAPVDEAFKKFNEAPEHTKEKLEAEIEYWEAQKKYYEEKGMFCEIGEANRKISALKNKRPAWVTSAIDLTKQGGLEKSTYEAEYFGPTYFNIKDREKELYSCYTKDSADYGFFMENRDLTLDSKVDLFGNFDKKTYDIPERYAIMADNSMRQKGNAYVFESVPEVFDGIKQEDIFENLSRFARSKKETKSIDFKIGEKKFHATQIGGGQVGIVYKIEDEAGHKVAMKIFGGRGKSLNMNCGLSEIATSRRLTQDKVGDVPQFYMANAGLYKLGKQGEVYDDSPWMLCEFIDKTKKPKDGSIKIYDWLSERNMYYADGFKNGKQNGYIIDVGGMVSKNFEDRNTWGINGLQNTHQKGLSDLLENALKSGHGVNDILKIFH